MEEITFLLDLLSVEYLQRKVIIVEKTMNKAMMVEHYGLCEKQKISAKKYEVKKREYCKFCKKHGNKADKFNCKEFYLISNVIKFRK